MAGVCWGSEVTQNVLQSWGAKYLLFILLSSLPEELTSACSCQGAQTFSFKGCIYKRSGMAIKLMTLLLLESHKKFPSCSSLEQIRVLQLLVPWHGSSWGYYIPPSSVFLQAPNADLSAWQGLNSGGAAALGTFKPKGEGNTEQKKREGRKEAILIKKSYVLGTRQRILH